METRQQIVSGFAAEYAKGTKGQKGVMLDYLCASTGWSRANARRRLAAELRKPEAPPRRPCPAAAPEDGARRLQAAGPDLDAVRGAVRGIPGAHHGRRARAAGALRGAGRPGRAPPTRSAAICCPCRRRASRYLKPLRDARYPSALSSTKPGACVRSEIPVRWSGTPMEQAPGFFEIDPVPTAGTASRVSSPVLDLTDVFTGWTVNGREEPAHPALSWPSTQLTRRCPTRCVPWTSTMAESLSTHALRLGAGTRRSS